MRPALKDDNRLGRGYFPGGGEERPGISNGFQVDDDACGLWVATQVINQVSPAYVHHRTKGDEGTETNACAQAPIRYGRAKGAALADEAYSAGGEAMVLAKVALRPLSGLITPARQSGPMMRSFPLTRLLQDLLLQLCTHCAGFL